jgi:hypothetical protein
VIVRPGIAVVLVAAVAALAACSGGGGGDTLQPIPIQGGTAAAPTVAVTATMSTTTTTVPVTAAVTGSVAGGGPVGDWDGARFDVGTISGLTKVGALDAISFDRWSYTAPDGSRTDAPHLAAEPVVAWWRSSPFANVQVRNRTFVLAPDVEVLVVAPAGRDAACADPPPAVTPAPSWDTADLAALSDPDNAGTIATLTYSDSGQVTRIRLTRGC